MAEFWQLSPNVSTFGADIDRMFYAIVVVTGVVFVLVEVLLLWFLFRYRAREGRRAVHTHGNMRMEILWAAATAVDAEGWTAEITIPVVTLRSPAMSSQTWGINFMRSIRRNRRGI